LPTIDSLVAERALAQHGFVTLDQLAGLGATTRMRRSRLAAGRWIKVDRRLIRLAGVPSTWASDLMAAVLAAGGDAVASHRSAAALWELEGSEQGGPEITIPISRTFQRKGIHVHRSTDLDRVEPIGQQGIPTTPVARTLLDLGAVWRRRQVHIAIDDARRRNLVTWDDLLSTLVAHARRGRNGVGTLRAILDDHLDEVTATESGLERLVVSVLLEAGLPRPALQYKVKIGGRTFRVDLAYPDERVAIELDGQHHLRREVWESDHERQNAFVLAGWTVLRFTWRDYMDRRSALVQEIWTAIGHR
jgi:very-short-patch-repair endonuclease